MLRTEQLTGHKLCADNDWSSLIIVLLRALHIRHLLFLLCALLVCQLLFFSVLYIFVNCCLALCSTYVLVNCCLAPCSTYLSTVVLLHPLLISQLLFCSVLYLLVNRCLVLCLTSSHSVVYGLISYTHALFIYYAHKVQSIKSSCHHLPDVYTHTPHRNNTVSTLLVYILFLSKSVISSGARGMS